VPAGVAGLRGAKPGGTVGTARGSAGEAPGAARGSAREAPGAARGSAAEAPVAVRGRALQGPHMAVRWSTCRRTPAPEVAAPGVAIRRGEPVEFLQEERFVTVLLEPAQSQ